jgi:hypothetical protein
VAQGFSPAFSVQYVEPGFSDTNIGGGGSAPENPAI